MNTSNVEKVKEFIFEYAMDETDIGNTAIESSMRFNVTINDFLNILKEVLLEKKIGLYSSEEYDGIENPWDKLDELFKYYRYNVFLYVI